MPSFISWFGFSLVFLLVSFQKKVFATRDSFFKSFISLSFASIYHQIFYVVLRVLTPKQEQINWWIYTVSWSFNFLMSYDLGRISWNLNDCHIFTGTFLHQQIRILMEHFVRSCARFYKISNNSYNQTKSQLCRLTFCTNQNARKKKGHFIQSTSWEGSLRLPHSHSQWRSDYLRPAFRSPKNLWYQDHPKGTPIWHCLATWVTLHHTRDFLAFLTLQLNQFYFRPWQPWSVSFQLAWHAPNPSRLRKRHPKEQLAGKIYSARSRSLPAAGSAIHKNKCQG